MRIFPLGLVLLAFFLIYEVLSDFSESMLPSKETRNRVHRTMRMSVRVGKRYGDAEFDDDDFKRSVPQFLLSPRVGKNDKTWGMNSLESLQKRSGNDPKATDLWFGPRIGRSNNDADRFEDIPWGYVIVNGNRLSNIPILKNIEGQQSKEESTE